MKKIKFLIITVIVILSIILIWKKCIGIEKDVTKLYEGGKYNEEKGVNTPKLAEGMTAIKWENGEIIRIESLEKNNDWYDYKNNMWANAITEDGSMWVWIPRYAYKIEKGYHSKETGIINIEFLKGKSNNGIDVKDTSGEKNWVIHPAFTNTKSKLGIGWDTEIEGFWVSKFEAGEGTINSNLRYGTNGTRASKIKNRMGEKIKYPKFEAGIASVNYINSNDIYCISRALTANGNPYGFVEEEIESMQITNAQWGACSYLTQSEDGSKGAKIEINDVERNGENETAQTGGEDYKINIQQSSTQNIYGVYDLVGGAWERVSAIIDNGNDYLRIYDYQLVKNKKTRYVDEYVLGTEDTEENNYYANKEIYGDGIWEVSNYEDGIKAWNNNKIVFPSQNATLIRRSGNYQDANDAGIFAMYITAGCETNSNSGYRVTLVNKK